MKAIETLNEWSAAAASWATHHLIGQGRAVHGAAALVLFGIGMLLPPAVRAQAQNTAGVVAEKEAAANPDGEKSADVPVVISLAVKADGNVYEAGDQETAISSANLKRDLAIAIERNPAVQVIISADPKTEHEVVVELVRVVSGAGVKTVGISSSEQPPRSVIGPAGNQQAGAVHRLAVAQPGIVIQVMAKKGDEVRRGDVLLKLDSRKAEAALRVAAMKAEVAERKLASERQGLKVIVKLIEERVEKGLATKAELVEAQMRAADPKSEGEFAIAKAEFELAKVELEQFTLICPVDGTIGGVSPQIGEYVQPSKPVFILRREVEPDDRQRDRR